MNIPAPPPSNFSEPSPSRIRSLVRAPAIALMVYAGISVFFAILGLALNLTGLTSSAMLERMGTLNDVGTSEMYHKMLTGPIGALSYVLSIVFSSIVFFGAYNMKDLRGWGLSLTAALIALNPCVSGCCLIGIPIGVWALIILFRADVKQAFS